MVFGGEGFGWRDEEDGKWIVRGLEVPPAFPGLEDGTLEFSHAEIRACFEGVTGRVGQLVAEGMGRGAEDRVVSVSFISQTAFERC